MGTGFIFSGQGAQFVGMGREISKKSSAASEIFSKADNVLGRSVSGLCFDGPSEKLTESKYCQPAIYTMSAACLAAFSEKYDIKADANAGLSLGEFAALYAGGVFDFEDGLKLVAARGELMDEACRENDGSMASILGGDEKIIQEVCEDCGIDIANYNCPGQIVVSGEKSKIKSARKVFKERGLRRIIPLKVAGAYHSHLMESASANFAEILSDFDLSEPSLPVLQNYSGEYVEEISEIRENLVKQVSGSVKWESCMRSMISKGIDTFIEFGPGNVLTGLAKRTDRSLKLFNIGKAEELENFSL